MKILKYLIGLLFFIGFTPVPAQNGEIEYEHRMLHKEMRKVWDINNPRLQEIDVPDSMAKETEGKYFAVFKEPDTASVLSYAYVGRVYSCRMGGCSSAESGQTNTGHEYFDYFILYDTNHVVQSIRVFNYEATHGHEITARGWLKQFKGFDGSRILKAEKDIDAISGATISVFAITDDVNRRTEMLQKLK